VTLAPGTRLGPYEVVASIGAGGMGEVYRGRDTRLGRDVALKILPDLVGQDKERLARFDREARVLASLTHPNIAALYAFEQIDGRPVLVMELAAGEDLSKRIDRGPLSIDEALPIAIRVASALEAAHEKGIVHRDLKPANIKLGEDSAVKVLDFGLAKAFGPDETDSASAMNSPTLTAQATAAGVILGTAAYMSPEQARGRAADKRADIWSLGVVLFEMLTGARLFHGETVSDTLAAVLRQDIDFAALQPGTPAELTRLLRRCLERDRNNRLHDAADARIMLDDILRGPTVSPAVTARRGPPIWAIAAAVVAATALGAVAGRLTGRPPAVAADTEPIRFTINAPPGVDIINRAAVSPDGSFVAFRGHTGTRAELYVHRLSEYATRRLDGTDGSLGPFISPDSQWIGFHRRNGFEKVSVDAGDTLPIAGNVAATGGTLWFDPTRLVVPPTWGGGLALLEVGTSKQHPLTTPDPSRGERAHWLPSRLPDGRHALFTIMRRGAGVNDAETAVVDVATGTYKVILQEAAVASYVPPGYLLFIRAGAYHAIRFDLQTLTVSDAPIRVLEDARGIVPDGEVPALSTSSTGTIAYLLGPRVVDTRFTWVAPGGKLEPLPFKPRAYWDLSLSPDGRYAAAGVVEGGRFVLRILELDRPPMEQLLDLPGSNWYAVWHPKDKDHRLMMRSMRKGDYDTYVKDIDSSEPAKPFLDTDFDDSPLAWLPPDGKFVVIQQSTPAGEYPLLKVDVADPKVKTELLRESQIDMAVASPDGRWLAMVITRGQAEVWVRPLFRDGLPKQVTTKGAQAVQWSPKTGQLIYTRPPEIIAVSYREENGEFRMVGEQLFARVDGFDFTRSFAVGRDGRVLIDLPVVPLPPPQIRVIVGFDRELARRFGAGR